MNRENPLASKARETPAKSPFLNAELGKYVLPHLYESPKHFLLYNLEAREILYGGVPGTGKTEALIHRACKYLHRPEYKCIILRKVQKSQVKASGIYSRMKEYLAPWIESGEIKHNETALSFRSIEGGTVEFSHLSAGFTSVNLGLEYQTIIIDELTQITQNVYDFWWSRLRRLNDQYFPTQIICATNPGDIGMRWVVRHWGIEKFGDPLPPLPDGDSTPRYRWRGSSAHKNRVFLHAEFEDNPALDIPNYLESLNTAEGVRKRQMKYGDWTAEEDSRYSERDFRVRWRKAQQPSGSLYTFVDYNFDEPIRSTPLGEIPPSAIDYQFTTVDLACSVKTGVNKTDFYVSSTKEIEPSWTVAATWAASGRWLILLDVVRIQAEAPEIIRTLQTVADRFPQSTFHMEANGPGKPMMQFFAQCGIPVSPIITARDKVTNSVQAQYLVRSGAVVLPEHAPWLQPWMDEVTGWWGLPDQTDDQIDTLSNAALLYQKSPMELQGLDHLKKPLYTPRTSTYQAPKPAQHYLPGDPMASSGPGIRAPHPMGTYSDILSNGQYSL